MQALNMEHYGAIHREYDSNYRPPYPYRKKINGSIRVIFLIIFTIIGSTFLIIYGLLLSNRTPPPTSSSHPLTVQLSYRVSDDVISSSSSRTLLIHNQSSTLSPTPSNSSDSTITPSDPNTPPNPNLNPNPISINPKLSYGELAAEKISNYFPLYNNALNSLNQDVNPIDVKSIRVAVETIRDLCDIFYAAYIPNENGEDIWEEGRISFEEGYKLIGDYQDMKDLPYTPEEINQHRETLLQWKENNINFVINTHFQVFLLHPSLDLLYLDTSNRTHLSAYWWSTVEVKPTLQKSAIENIAILTDAILEKLSWWQEQVLKLDDIFELQDHIEMHAFRKHCRSILRIVTYFPGILEFKTVESQEAYKVIYDLYYLYGDLNDQWTAYSFYKQRQFQDESMANQYKIVQELVHNNWVELKKKQKDSIDLVSAVKTLRGLIVIKP